MLVNLTGMDGSTVAVNSDEVFSLQTIAASLMPAGIANGVKITTEDGATLAVQGTLAGVAAALTGVLANTVRCTIDGATGNVLAQSPAGAVLLSVRSGVGVYKVTLAPPGIVAPNTLLTISDVSPFYGVVSNASGDFDVETYDAAGAPADTSFNLFISSY